MSETIEREDGTKRDRSAPFSLQADDGGDLMALQADHGGSVEGAESRAWDRFFRVFFKTTPHPMLRGVRRVIATPIEEIVVVGRRTGRERRHLVTLIDIDGRLYVGHPNGRSQWARNLEANGTAVLIRRGSPPISVRAAPLAPGGERSAAIEASGHQPFPAGLIFRSARSHIEAVGAYYRLEPLEAGATDR